MHCRDEHDEVETGDGDETKTINTRDLYFGLTSQDTRDVFVTSRDVTEIGEIDVKVHLVQLQYLSDVLT